MTDSDVSGARLLGVDAPPREPSAATLELVRAALDGALDEDGLGAPDFEDFVAALVRLAPEAAERMTERGLPPAVRADTLTDVGRKIAAYGDDGIRGWAIELMRGAVITLGRLQFETTAGEHGHSVHIPELGPLDQASVDDALDRARQWFGDDARFCCASWLLDPRLAELGDASNIVRFQRRFRVVDSPESPSDEEADRSVTKFVFRLPPERVIELDTDGMSSLQRLVAGVLKSGGHWTELLGVLRNRTETAGSSD